MTLYKQVWCSVTHSEHELFSLHVPKGPVPTRYPWMCRSGHWSSLEHGQINDDHPADTAWDPYLTGFISMKERNFQSTFEHRMGIIVSQPFFSQGTLKNYGHPILKCKKKKLF